MLRDTDLRMFGIFAVLFMTLPFSFCSMAIELLLACFCFVR